MRGSNISRLAVLGCAALALAACTGHSLKPKQTGSAQPSTRVSGQSGTSAQTILVAGGAHLSALLIVPQHRAGSTLPLLVMPASWGSNSTEYGYAAETFAQHGYIVLSYAQRGFAPSTGEVDFGDTQTQQDVSTVIDWATAHAPVDAGQVGLAGVSYGGGVSLLAAERDRRIKAVVAMSAWTDLSAMLVPNGTVAAETINLLISPRDTATFASELTAAAQGVRSRSGAATTSMAKNPARSASNGVAALNSNHTAVLIANDAQDSLIAPNELITFFDQLTGPKRLRLDVGGHGSSELSGFKNPQAARTGVWKDALDWLDHYLRGVDNGAQNAAPVTVHDFVTKRWFDYPAWPATGHVATYSLNAGGGAASASTGSLTPTATTWTRSLVAGSTSAADAGPGQIGVPTYTAPSTSKLTTISPTAAVVTHSAALAASERISGVATVHLNVASSSPAATVVAYLYDVDATGKATLVTYAPYTTAVTGGATPIDIPLRAVEWTLAAGHRIALAVGTTDQQFLSGNALGSTLTITSTAASPAVLRLPLGS